VYNWTLDQHSESFVSLRLWLSIDPHVFLYTFLPLLLFGDAMSLNVHVLRQKLYQVLLLGPAPPEEAADVCRPALNPAPATPSNPFLFAR